jgi:glucosamine kinase
MDQNTFVVGVDAGGTRTRAALGAAADGAPVLATGTSGPGNAASVPPERLAAHYAQALAAAVAPERRPGVRAVVAGIAGCSPAADWDPATATAHAALASALRTLGIAPGVVEVRSDPEVALASAPGHPCDGLVLIAGTGAAAARIAAGRQCATVDGDGWLLGDAGSAFWIGRRAVRRALAALDGRGRPTLLAESVATHYLGEAARTAGPDLRARVAEAVRARPPIDLAAVCPLVTAAAGQGDETARRILRGAAERLATTLRALDPRPGEPLVTTGGLLGPGGPLLPALTGHLAALGLRPVPVRDGAAGAVALARAALRNEALRDEALRDEAARD